MITTHASYFSTVIFIFMSPCYVASLEATFNIVSCGCANKGVSLPGKVPVFIPAYNKEAAQS